MASMFICRTLTVLLLLCSVALAGGRGGHNTTFDPNSYGGNWTTINCTGNDDAAFNSWVTAAKAANPAITPLRITGNCVITPSALLDGINNVVIWGYGSTISDMAIGFAGATFPGTPYFTNDANIGDTSVVLVTAADSSNFTVGQYMIMTGFEVQYPDCGSPPNTQFFDFVAVTAITGTTTKTINFSPPLTNNYKSTWPLVCGDGPAAAYPLGPNYQTNIKIFGMTMSMVGQIVIRGRDIQLVDCVFRIAGVNGNLAPTMASNISISNGFMPTTEFDKLIDTISLYNVSGSPFNWLTQSASIKTFNLTNTSVAVLSGTPLNTTIVNSSFPLMAIGPNGYGAARSLVIQSLTAPSGFAGLSQVLKSATSYSSGTISMLLNDGSIGAFVHTFVPGFKYVLASDHCPNCGVPTVAFTVLNTRIDGTTYYVDTDLMSTPTATCSGSPCTHYTSFGAQTIFQTLSSGVNWTLLAAPP